MIQVPLPEAEVPAVPFLASKEAERDAVIVAHLLKMQQRQLRNDSGHGYCTAKDIAQVIRASPITARTVLHRLADEGLIRREVFINGIFWRSINPLPWEPGGKWPGQVERKLRDLEQRLAETESKAKELRRAIDKLRSPDPCPKSTLTMS